MPTATILVTDLVGSTELRSRLGEEAADRLHRLHERLLRDAVEEHGGVVVNGLGDGLASFTGALNGYQWARTLLARRAPGDRERALELAGETLAYCRQKGYATFVTKTEELLATWA